MFFVVFVCFYVLLGFGWVVICREKHTEASGSTFGCVVVLGYGWGRDSRSVRLKLSHIIFDGVISKNILCSNICKYRNYFGYLV